MIRHSLLASGVLALGCGSASAAPVVFDFNSAIDNNDGTVSNIGGFNPAGSPVTQLSVSTAVDGSSSGIALNIQENDGFVVAFENFNSVPEGGGTVPFNELLELGGTITGDAVFTVINDGPTENGTVPADGLAQLFMARQGSTTGFDLTDSDENDDNFNFTGTQALDTVFSFTFTLPTLAGDPATSNLDDVDDPLTPNVENPFYGIAFGVGGGALAGTTVVLDNVVFTPIPEPGSLALIGLGGLTLVARRRRHG